jgi:hypothetical protein
VERKLKMGDVLHIDAGSTFYMVNPGKGQRLQIICSVDASDSLGFGPPYQVSPPPLLFCTLVVFLFLLLAGKRTCSTYMQSAIPSTDES